MEKQFLVALHAYTREQVLREAAKILTPEGAHGVLIVNNGGYIFSEPDDKGNLFDITIEVKNRYPQYFVGINPLDLETKHALEAVCTEQANYMELLNSSQRFLDALWTDDGGIREHNGEAYLREELKHNLGYFGLSSFGIKYYGGIAFKYLEQPKNLALVAQTAAKFFSAVITSGPATGKEADVDKIRTIKSCIGAVPLGLASGLTVENLDQYFEYVDIFIVGTSLLESSGNQFMYSREKVEAFRSKVEALKKPLS